MQEKKQRFEWGTIEWLYLPGDNSHDNMHIGISTMWPHAVQTRHVHCGDEQFMYIISGYGEQRIGDELTKIEPGRMFHISAGSMHETINRSDEPIIKLLISTPVALASHSGKVVQERFPADRQDRMYGQVSLLSVLQQLNDSLISPLKMPVAFYDSDQTFLLRNNEYPEYCRRKCGIQEDLGNCCLYSFRDNHAPPYYADATAYVCSHGISMYSLAIVHRNTVIGFLKSGHVRVAVGDEDAGRYPDYEVPQSTVSGIVQTMHRLAGEICERYQFENMQMELIKQEGDITEQQYQKDILQQSLRSTQTEILNLQIEQHFLFNTLSTIASMAIRESAISTYRAVNDLAQLFRYTLRTSKLFVELREELEYLENYTNLQKLRYEDRLKVTYTCPPSLLRELVPFNFIQPFVENCFKHAFQRSAAKTMRLTIRVKLVGANLQISVQDNGCGMDDDTMRLVDERIRSVDSSGGTAMVVRKLSSLYGTNYSVAVERPKAGTMVVLTIPRSLSKGERP